MSNDFRHEPVLFHEVLANLVWDPSGIYIDATFGRGGHSQGILSLLKGAGRLLALDRDLEAVTAAKAIEDVRFSIRHGAFSLLQETIKEFDWVGKVSGILLDLGVSSPQLDDASRGFSFIQDGPLDMRMDTTQKLTAETWLNTANSKEIADVLWQYGEERFSRRIARAILAAREVEPIISTSRLSAIVSHAIPKWEKDKHPATRSFQAIRIFINNELGEIEVCLKQCLEVLAVHGRLLVITFHSLEDRLVKNFLQQYGKSGYGIPSEIPITRDEFPPRIRLVKKALEPSAMEVKRNPRSRSAKLRILEKLS